MIEDFNNDGLDDLLLVGNDYGSEIGMGRYDASNGLVLINNGSDFDPLNPGESGFLVSGDAKSSVYLISNNEPIILIGQNRGEMRAFKTKIKNRILNLDKYENHAEIFENGIKYKKEFYYGNSFLSQSSRTIIINNKVDSIYFFNNNKLNRKVVF